MDTQTSDRCAITISKPSFLTSPSGERQNKTKQNSYFLCLSLPAPNSKLGCSIVQWPTLMMTNVLQIEKGPQTSLMPEALFCLYDCPTFTGTASRAQEVMAEMSERDEPKTSYHFVPVEK